MEEIVAASGWVTGYEAALATAKAEKKLVLADFTGSDWCGWCKKLKAEVFDQPAFQEWAQKNVVLLELEYPASKPMPPELKQLETRSAQSTTSRATRPSSSSTRPGAGQGDGVTNRSVPAIQSTRFSRGRRSEDLIRGDGR